MAASVRENTIRNSCVTLQGNSLGKGRGRKERGDGEHLSKRGGIDTPRILTQKNLDNKMSIFFSIDVETIPKLP